MISQCSDTNLKSSLSSDLEMQSLNTALEKCSPHLILAWAIEQFGQRLALVTSFQPTGIVTLHMLTQLMPDIAVLTVDTGYLFPETYDFIEKVRSQFNLNLHYVRPREDDVARLKPGLWQTNPDDCCHVRKVVPLKNALAPYDAWIAGLRRDQSPTRSNTPIVSRDRYQKIKLSPFATWTEDMITEYIQVNDLPYNPLHDQGYASIGCYPCTRPVRDDEPSRAGRWSGHAKTECGIHFHKN